MKKDISGIELAIVAALMAILLGIALPRLQGIDDEEKASKAANELKSLQTAVESCRAGNHRAYPPALSVLRSWAPLAIGSSLHTDPFKTGKDYGYALSDNGNHYVIYSMGQSGNGSATVDNNGTITEANGSSCIYVSNSGIDTEP